MAEAMPFDTDEDYYAILNVPRDVGLIGLQNAYARLSSDLAERLSVDPTAREELIRLNRAFGVLGNSELRQRYDAIRFGQEAADEGEAEEVQARRSQVFSNILFGVLLTIVAVQVAVVGYFARDEIGEAVSALVGTFVPTGAS